MGWCFGGQHSLLLSLNEELDATVIYYGNVDVEDISSISGPVLGIFGAQDTSISVESVRDFQAKLNLKGVENDIRIYADVGHAFANPSGSNYAPAETLDAWERTVDFLETNLKAPTTEDAESTEIAETESSTKTFELTGRDFAFFMDGESRPEIRVKEGDRVRIEFTSTQGYHDWVVDEFDAATEKVNEGGSTFVEFTADRKGEFEYYCSVGSHRERGMWGMLIVE
jgi:plastocyanin